MASSKQKKRLGWEVARDLERRKATIRQRVVPERRQIRAALVGAAIFFLVYLLGCWLAAHTERLDSAAMQARGWSGTTRWSVLWTVVLLSLVFEYMDAAAGMGFGTALTPLLLVLGFDPLQIVPAVMIQQAAAGLVGAFLHREFENVDWSLRPLSETVRLWLFIAGAGVLAVVFSVTAVYGYLKLARVWIVLYVTVLLVGMGIVSLLHARRERVYRPRLMLGFGLLAGFNIGIGGGGYGPVVTIGGLLAGVPVKSMLAVTALAEGTVCVGAVAVWLWLSGAGVAVDLFLLPSLMLGTTVAAVLAPYTTRVLPERIWRVIVPLYCLVVAGIAIWKLVPELRQALNG